MIIIKNVYSYFPARQIFLSFLDAQSGVLMYNLRDDKSFTRTCNYRLTWWYRVFFAAISREIYTEEKSELITGSASSLTSLDFRQWPVCHSVKAQLTGCCNLPENYKQRDARNIMNIGRDRLGNSWYQWNRRDTAWRSAVKCNAQLLSQS